MRASLDVDARRLTGELTIRLRNPQAVPLDRIYLWLYGNRHARPPRGLDDVTIYWFYPRHVTVGAMGIDVGWLVDERGRRPLPAAAFAFEPHALAGERTLVSVRLDRPLAPGATALLGLRYRARLPERYGWGCTGGGCLLPGGYAPMLASLDQAGFDLAAPPAVGDVEVDLQVARPASIVLGGEWSGDGARRLHVRARRVPYLPLVVAPHLHESRRTAAGATYRVLSPTAPPPADDARGVMLPYTLEDDADAALVTAIDAAALFARWSGLRPVSQTIVEVPLRTELAAAHPGVVLLSDRFFRIWPAERFRKFHRRHLVRAAIAGALAPRLAAGGAAPGEVQRATEAIATHLGELYTVEAYARRELLGQILRPVSFVPAVDQLLYAPQTLFADAYFGGDSDLWRDDVRRFAAEAPRGRFLYDKLRDLIGEAALERALREVAVARAPLAAAAERAHGAPLDWFFHQWSGPPGRYGVRLAGVTSERRGRGATVRVTVERQVVAGDLAPIEPIEVLVSDKAGGEHRQRWDGRGARGTLTFALPAPLRRVTVDPDARLSESKLPGQVDHVRFDNVSHHPKRFVYYGLGVLVNVSDLSVLLAADFRLSRVHDLQNSARFIAYQSASTRIGARATYRRNFGAEVTPDRLLGQAALSLGVARLDTAFFEEAGDAARPATSFSLTAAVGGDTEVFMFEPLDKDVLQALATVTATRRDAGAGLSSDYLVTTELGVMAATTATPRLGHTLAGQLGGTVVLGDLAGRAQLIPVGGAPGVRGYTPGARFGRAVLSARGEYRHAFVHDLDWNVGQYSFYRGFGGVLFTDLAWATPCDSYAMLRRDGAVASVGYGLQMFYDNFGTLPSVMRLDAALRLTGEGPSCFGVPPPEASRVQIYLTFIPPF